MGELRIVLLGKQGAGKSASGNTLLRNQSFHTAASSERVTQVCSTETCTVNKQTIKVVDTPGWCDSSPFKTDIKKEIISMSSPGPHAVLLVLPIGRFTNEEVSTVMNILKEFGDEVTKYMIVLFTKGDDLEGRPIEDYLKELHSDLTKIIQLCGGRYHVFNNRDKTNHDQVSSLLKKVNKMLERNEGKFYTTDMYQNVKDQQKDDTRRQQYRREKDHSPQDKSKNQSRGQNGDRGNRCDTEKYREGISEVRMERSQEQMAQQQISTQNREHEITLENKSNENGEEQRRREKSGEDDKRRKRYSYDDDARSGNMEEIGEISREKRLEQMIDKLYKLIKEREDKECKWNKEKDWFKLRIHHLQNELIKRECELEQLKQEVKAKTEIIEHMERLWTQPKTDENTKTNAILDFFQKIFR